MLLYWENIALSESQKQDIFNDTDVRDSRVSLAANEQEYKQLCQPNPKSNAHWLEKEKAGNSFGSNRKES
jgi:hypothetical protein